MASGQKEAQNKTAEDPEEPKKRPKRLMIEFENLTFIAQDFTRFNRTQKVSSRHSSGIEYLLIIHMRSHPYEENFSYDNIADRDRAYELLRMKLQDCGVIFELAKPTELPPTEPLED